MAYTPNEWGVGNLITASKMNKIERQLVANTSDLDDIRNGVTVPTYDEFETLRDDVAAEYDNTKTYAVGDYVIYNTQLYKCKTAITSAETWTVAHWDAVEVGEELQRIEGKNEEGVAELKSALDDIATIPSDETLLDTVVSSPYTQTVSRVIDGLQAGEIVQITITPDNISDVNYNVLTSAVEGGQTIRNIQMSTVGINTVSITLEGSERVLTLRLVNQSGTVRNFAVNAVKIITGDPAIKENVLIPVDSTLSIQNKPADAKAVGDALALKQDQLTFDQAPTAGSTNPVTSGGVAAVDDQITESVDEIKSALEDIANVPTKTILVDTAENFVGPGNKRIEVTGQTAGSIIDVTVTVTEAQGASWEILTSTTPVAGTIRQIVGGTLADNTPSTVRVILQGQETAIVIRLLITQSTGNRKYWTAKAVKLSAPETTVKLSAIDAQIGSVIDTNKKIVWFGTSIPEGNRGSLSYPLVLGQKLGVTVYNEAVGSSRARASWAEFITASNPLGAGSGYNSMTKAMGYSLAEKQYFIDHYDELKSRFSDSHPDTLTPETQLAIKNYSFERKLYRYLTEKQATYNTVNSIGFVGDVDLYVLDHGYNDVPNSPYVSDSTVPALGAENEMYYFAGALNRYIKEIMQANIHAKIIIISHYSNTGGAKTETIIEMQNKVAKFWNIPIINIYEKIGWTDVEITVGGTTKTVKNAWLPDGVHPASDTSGNAVKRYVEILYPFFRDYLQKY